MNPTEPETDLDLSLAAARNDGAQANYFYDAFLNTELYMPVKQTGTTEGSWKRLGLKDRFHPLFLASGEMKVVPLFDKLERLQGWAGTKPLDYFLLKGHVLVSLMGAGVAFSLNPGTSWGYVFSPEIIERLRQAMKPVAPM